MKRQWTRIAGVFFLLAILCATPIYAGSQATSGVTAQVMIDTLRRDLVDPTGNPFFTDADFIKWMDQAVFEIVSRTKCLESGISNVILIANTWSYAISGSFFDVDSVIYNSGDTTSATQVFTLDRIDVKAIGHSKETGKPKFFCLWNDNLLIWPIPRTSEAGTTLTLYLATMPSGVTATTSPIETPTYFDNAILDFTKGQAYAKDSQPALSDYYLKRFYAKIEDYLQRVIKKTP